MDFLLEMYVTILPVIVAGILNMIFVKSKVLNKLKMVNIPSLILKN